MSASRPLVVDMPVIEHDIDPVQSDVSVGDPGALAAAWLPAPDEERMLMTLSTIDGEGFPRARTVMLSEFDGERYFFHTDADSEKVSNLRTNPRVSLTLLWPGFTRQIVVQGVAEVASSDEQADAYAKRSPYLKQLAWLNTEAYANLPLEDRRREWASFAERHPEPALAPGWTGYAVTAHRVLFWVSNPDAAGRRVEFVRDGSAWRRRYLPG